MLQLELKEGRSASFMGECKGVAGSRDPAISRRGYVFLLAQNRFKDFTSYDVEGKDSRKFETHFT